jgi:hypothetical protein
MNHAGLSGEACVARLEALGFTVFRRRSAVTLLERGRRRVLVPHIASLGTEMLEGVLRSAGVTEAELLQPTQARAFSNMRIHGLASSVGHPRGRQES